MCFQMFPPQWKRPFSFQPYCGVCPVSTAQHLGASGYSSWYYKYIYICMYIYVYGKIWLNFFQEVKSWSLFFQTVNPVLTCSAFLCAGNMCVLCYSLNFSIWQLTCWWPTPLAFATALPIVSLRIAVRQRRSGSAILGQRDKKGTTANRWKWKIVKILISTNVPSLLWHFNGCI